MAENESIILGYNWALLRVTTPLVFLMNLSLLYFLRGNSTDF